MPSPNTQDPRFDPTALSALDEPVRRYFAHAIREGAPTGEGVRLRMTGRIKVGRLWLDFDAEQDCNGRSFIWNARAGKGSLRPLQVIDRYQQGMGSTEGRLFGRVPLFHAADENTTRSAAARSAVEGLFFAPTAVLVERSVTWEAESNNLIVATFQVAPERPVLRVRIDDQGALESANLKRWGNVGQKNFGYIPFGVEVHAERRFGELTLPSQLSVGWWFGTPRYQPFFEATILDVAPLGPEG